MLWIHGYCLFMLTLNLLIFLSLHFFEGLSVTLVHSLYPHSSVSSGIRPHCLCINKQRPSRAARNWINRWRESIKLTQIKPPTHLSCSMWVIPPPPRVAGTAGAAESGATETSRGSGKRELCVSLVSARPSARQAREWENLSSLGFGNSNWRL